MSIGIKNLAAVEFFVRDLERASGLLIEKMDFAHVATGDESWQQRNNTRSHLFEAGQCRIILSVPEGDGEASAFLNAHPEGIGSVYFEVENAQTALSTFESRGGTPTSDVEALGAVSLFGATTPFGAARFKFFERTGEGDFLPGLVPLATPQGGSNRFGFEAFDHMTSNFMTMSPLLLWLEHVMGFERYWDIEFHTKDVSQVTGHAGSGLKSVVMWDPKSGVKFANNEPFRPFFENSQISIFCNDNRGPGIQHLALSVPDIEKAVRGLRSGGADFLHTPGNYYDALPGRLDEVNVGAIDEDMDMLRDTGILVDGEGPGQYLLQIFLKDLATQHDDSNAGPFFFEVIQRKGAKGFGGGNFRALFESIEREQVG